MVTERAIIFDKVKLRNARSVVMYGLPESPDTLTDVLAEILNCNGPGFESVQKLRVNLIKNDKEKSPEVKINLI